MWSKNVKQSFIDSLPREQREQEGREQGEKIGIEKGKELGLKQGKKETKQKLKEIAKKLKEQKMSKKQIAEITGLSEEEIKALDK